MRKVLLSTMLFAALSGGVFAQRTTDKLDRGLVALPGSGGTFVSWRIMGEEYYDVEYNLYRDGVKLNETPLKVSNYTDAGGTGSSKYQVAAVVRGVEQEKSAAVTRWNNGYLDIPMQSVINRAGANVTSNYTLNDVSLADVD
ncbi:MAG: rhamnogalacturonan lyase, partial [Bacteroidaceae bacterium]|nr:rhamnogalacturonan lyase [Bacteroidaceae bacterium]